MKVLLIAPRPKPSVIAAGLRGASGGGGDVLSVNGYTGVVTLAAMDVGAATSAQGALAATAVQPGDLATVATTGAYADLSGAPTLGTAAGQNIEVFDAAGAADDAVMAHTMDADPHPQYSMIETLDDLSDVIVATPIAGDVLTYNTVSGQWENAQPPGAEGGEANTASNVGAGVGVFQNKVGVDLRLRSIVAGTNVTVTEGADSITIAAAGGGGGAVDSVNGQTGVVVLDAADVGADVAGAAAAAQAAAIQRANHTGTQAISTVSGLQTALDGKEAGGAAASAVAAHEAASDPHPQYLTMAEGGAAYAPLSHVSAGGTAHANVIAGGAAGFMTGADKTKLDGVAAGANNYSHPNHTGDVMSVGDGVQTIANNAVTNAKAADMAVNTIKGRITTGTGDPEDLTATQVRTVLNVADGAVAPSPVITESTTARTLTLSDANAYIRHTNASASTVTVAPQSSVAWVANTEVYIRRAAAGSLTLTPGSGVTLNAPSGGTLVLTSGMSVGLKRVAENVWDVIGQTVAA